MSGVIQTIHSDRTSDALIYSGSVTYTLRSEQTTLPELPHARLEDGKTSLLDSGAQISMIKFSALSEDEKRQINPSEYSSVQGVGVDCLRVMGEIDLLLKIDGSGHSPINVRHLVHENEAGPTHLLGQTALQALRVILDYERMTVKCGDRWWPMEMTTAMPHPSGAFSVSAAAPSSRFFKKCFDEDFLAPAQGLTWRTKEELRAIIGPAAYDREVELQALQSRVAQWDQTVVARATDSTTIPAFSSKCVRITMHTPGLRPRDCTWALLEPSKKDGHVMANTVYATPNYATASEVGLRIPRCTFDVTCIAANANTNFAVSQAYIMVTNTSGEPLVLPRGTTVGKVGTASHTPNAATWEVKRSMHDYSKNVARPYAGNLTVRKQALEQVAKREREIRNLQQLPPTVAEARAAARAEAAAAEERELDQQDWPFEYQMPPQPTKEWIDAFNKTRNNVRAARERQLAVDALAMAIVQLREQEASLHNDTHREVLQMQRASMPAVNRARAINSDWSFEDRAAQHDAEDVSPPSKSDLSKEALQAAIIASVAQMEIDGSSPQEVQAVRQLLDELILPMAYDPNSKGTRAANVEPVRYILREGMPPKFHPPRYYSPAGKAFKRQQEEELLEMGVIEMADSPTPWASAVHLAKKKNGEFRFTIDLKHVKDLIVADAYKLPRTDDLLDALLGSRYFTTLDLKSGFWQFPIHPESRGLTAFHGEDGKMYQFTRLVQGMKTSSAEFQRRIDLILTGLTYDVCLTYIDDVIIYTATFDEHIRALRKVLMRLAEANMTLNLPKCRFAARSVAYLGYRVSEHGIHTDARLTDKVKDLKGPLSAEEARSLLGLTVHFRRFIYAYSDVCEPIRNAVNQAARTLHPLKWTPECEEALAVLKEALVTSPVMAIPDPSRPYRLYTDASGYAIGCTLTQLDDNGVERVVLYDSLALQREQRAWNTTEKEAYAVVHYVQKLQRYLDNGLDFLVFTDHSALVTILKNPKDKGKLLRWSLSLLPFANHMLIQHWPGKDQVADFFSRHPSYRELAKLKISPSRLVLTPMSDEEISSAGNLIPNALAVRFANKTFETNMIQETTKLMKMQLEDPFTSALYQAVMSQTQECDRAIEQKIRDRVNHTLRKDGERFRIGTDAVLKRFNDKDIAETVVPEGLQLFVLASIHDSPLGGHLASDKMISKLKDRFWWPRMATDVEDWNRACHLCQMHKTKRRHQRGKLQTMTAYEPFALTSMDLIGPLPETARGNKYLLVWTDHHTRWVEAIAIPDKSAMTVAKAFHENIVTRYGPPFVVMSDRGSEFLNKIFNEYNLLMGTARFTSSPYHPETDGMVERFNATLISMMAPFVCYAQNDWDSYVSAACFAYRTAVHATSKFSPYKLMFGWESRQPMDVVFSNEPKSVPLEEWMDRIHDTRIVAARNTVSAQAKTKERVDKNRSDTTFKVGDLVRARVLAGIRRDPNGTREFERDRSIKLAWKFRGPFKIESLDGHQAKLVRPMNSKATRVANIDDIETYWTNKRIENLLSGAADSKSDDELAEDEYYVEAIKAHRDTDSGIREYCVKWEGFDDKREDTWESLESFNDIEIVADYEQGLLRGNDPQSSRFASILIMREQKQSQKRDVLYGGEPSREKRRQPSGGGTDHPEPEIAGKGYSMRRTVGVAPNEASPPIEHDLEMGAVRAPFTAVRGRERDSFYRDDEDTSRVRRRRSPPPPPREPSARLGGKRVNVYSQFTNNTNDFELQDIDLERVIDQYGVSYMFL